MATELADLIKGGALTAAFTKHQLPAVLNGVEAVSRGAEGGHWLAIA